MRVYERDGSKVLWMDHRAGGRRHRKSAGTANRRKAEARGRVWAQQLDERYSVERVEVKLSVAIKSFLEDCRRARNARNTLRSYRGHLEKFLAFTGDEDLGGWSPDFAYERVAAYLSVRTEDGRSSRHDRLVLSALFTFLCDRRWYKGENPAAAKLHKRRQPRSTLKKQKRCTTHEEDMTLRQEGAKTDLWPLLLLTRWAGLRRGEACALRWSEVNLDEGYADVVGHEGGRKHPRRVRLSPSVAAEFQKLRPPMLPEESKRPVWPWHPDTATDMLGEFRKTYGLRHITFNDLRASFATDCYKRGMTPSQESRIVGHSVAVAEKHYLEYEAREAREMLPPVPLTPVEDARPDAASDASGAQFGHSRADTVKRETPRIARMAT